MTHHPDSGFTRPEERALREVLERRQTPRCPRCDVLLEPCEVAPRADVAYVRRRTWWVCGRCRRSLVVDL